MIVLIIKILIKIIKMNPESNNTEQTPEPKKRGRKAIPNEQKKRSYHIKCPCCNECFEWYHNNPDMRPPPVTTKDMTAKEKNRIYQARYRERHIN